MNTNSSSGLLSVELAPDCRVLLWGRLCKADGKPIGDKQPVLWVREVPRAPSRGEPKLALPPQRVAVTTLGSASDFELTPQVRLIAIQMIAWAADDSTRSVDEGERLNVLSTSPK